MSNAYVTANLMSMPVPMPVPVLVLMLVPVCLPMPILSTVYLAIYEDMNIYSYIGKMA